MKPDEARAEYLTSASGDVGSEKDRLDVIRRLLGEDAVWADLPSQVLEGILAEMRTGRAVAIAQPTASRRRAWLFVAAAVVIVLLGLAAAALFDSPPGPVTVVAMSGTDLAPEASGTASLRPTPAGWAVSLDVEGLPPAPQGSYYQAWVWNDGDAVSLGTFHFRNGVGPIVLWAGVNLRDYPSLSVTLQDEGGGPASSGRVVMTGRVTEFAEG